MSHHDIKKPLLDPEVYSTERKVVVASEDDSDDTLVLEIPTRPRRSSFLLSSSRRIFDVFTGAGTGGRFCGTDGTTFIIRIMTLLPMPIFVYCMSLASLQTQTSLAVDTIKSPIQMCSLGLVFFSRFLSYVSKKQMPTMRPAGFEWVEILVVVGGAYIVATFLAVPIASVTNLPWLAWITLSFIEIPVFVPLHMLIKQVMLAQKAAVTGYAVKIGMKVVMSTIMCCVVILYCINVLTPSSNPNSKEMAMSINVFDFQPIVASMSYTCANKESFANYTSQFSMFQAGKGSAVREKKLF